MGLCIYGEITKKSISRSYSVLHNTARYLAFVCCGMPPTIGVNSIGEPIDTELVVRGGHPWGMVTLDREKMEKFLSAVQMTGRWFPNLLLHSDCEGGYTKRGPTAPAGKYWTKGNSVQLLKELETICGDKKIQKSCEISERIKRAMEYTIEFRDLVKDEIENGKGKIYFS